eukprot:comp17225_c0_seq1/m.16217 comp17225_c0_seq1/g.16217  ORF comp17225_c0_seq1/g.16217 comp17225_c0_seq1/m.16217 type:complete len:671 (-) comp17225_c0_seq1:213-2225(-)
MASSTAVPVLLVGGCGSGALTAQWCSSQLVLDGLGVCHGQQEGGRVGLADVPAVYSGMVWQALHYFESAHTTITGTHANQHLKLVQEVAERYRSVLEQAASEYIELAKSGGEEEHAHRERAALAFQMRDVLNLVALVFVRASKPTLAQPLFRKWLKRSEDYWRYSRTDYLENWQRNLPTDPNQRNEEIMWRQILQALLVGRIADARNIAATNVHLYPTSTWALEQLDTLLGTMPTIEDNTTYRQLGTLQQWQSKCQQAQQEAHQNGPRLAWLVFALLGGGEEGSVPGRMGARVALDTIAKEFGLQWQDYTHGYVSYVKPFSQFVHLPSDIDTLCPVDDDHPESGYRQLIDAILSGDAIQTLDYLHRLYSSAWLSAHIADLLAACGHLNTVTTPLLGGLDVRQHCLLRLACELMQFSGDMWQAVLCYLGHCGGPGALHASAYISGLQLPADSDWARLLHYCKEHGLDEAARAACVSQARACVERGQYGQALLWLQKGGDTQQSLEVGLLVLRLCLGLGGLDAAQMATLQDTVALAASQLQGTLPSIGVHLCAAGYIVAYRRALSEGSMQEAWEILADALTKKALPMPYLHLLLFADPNELDAVGLFEGASAKAGRLSFRRQDVVVVMGALEDLCASPHLRSFEATVDPSRVLRLRVALGCALASATLAPRA